MNKTIGRMPWFSTVMAFGSLFLICALIRFIFAVVYEPISFPDTPTYESVAAQIGSLNFSQYLGARTPVYPILLLLARMDHRIIWFIQSLMGIGISLMLFGIAFTETHNPWGSFIIGLSYSVSLNELFFEANILTETLSTFLFVGSLAVIITALHSEKLRIGLHLLLGIAVALAGLTRPLLLFLLPLDLVFLFLIRTTRRVAWIDRLKYLSAFFIPAALLVLAWSFFNQITVDYFGVTTLLGFNLTQHSGGFIELAPDKYQVIRDIYLAYRQLRIAENGSHIGTIWRAQTDMLHATGLTFSQLSRELTQMSVDLFSAHPMLYLESVLDAWFRFWTVQIYWQLDSIKIQSLRPFLQWSWRLQRLFFFGANATFLLMSAGGLSLMIRNRRPISSFSLLVISTVLFASVLQATLEHGENARYSIPFQPLVVSLLLIWAFRLRSYAQRRTPTA